MSSRGTLYVVATPLGNLGDLTQRAVRVLQEVSVVAAEDTRHTQKLLDHIGARPRLISFHAHSPPNRARTLIQILEEGRDIALVTDAGTPLISDPGAQLVAEVRARGISVVPIPGPAAVITALSAAGLPADRFVFMGFPPRRGASRRELLERAAQERFTTVFYESPNRLVTLLTDLAELAGSNRSAVVARELTKLHEEFRAGTLSELADHFSVHEPRGEITVLLAGSTAPIKAPDDLDSVSEAARELLAQGFSRKEVGRMVAERFSMSRNDAYRLVTGLE